MMSLPTEREKGRSYVTGHNVTGAIALNELSFAYPQTSQSLAPRVLKGVTVRVKAGERIAILGRIGSGKSTILRLIAGLYQPTEGMVDVDGLEKLIADGKVSEGMIPKLESCVSALRHGVRRAHILDGRLPHALLLEFFTREGVGTMVHP